MNTNEKMDTLASEYTETTVELRKAFEKIQELTNRADAAGFVSDGLVHEATTDFRLNAAAFAIIIMQYFDWDNDSSIKHFLLELAEELGPDHIENLRKSAAFMQKVDQF